MNNRGMTMAEVTTSFAILAIAALGLGGTTARLARVAVEAEARATAIQVIEDRIVRVQIHPVYASLDSVYSEVNANVPGLPGYTRTTAVRRIRRVVPSSGRHVDFTMITVSVQGPGLSEGLSRTVAVGSS